MARGKTKELLVVHRRRIDHLDDEEENHGTWKIAYADFVTAMMAFFLLMWLLNVTTKEQREGLADYFNPVAVSQERSGADGALAGRSVDKSGALTSPHAQGTKSLPVASPPVVASVGADDRSPAGIKDPSVQAPKPAQGERTEVRDLLRPGAPIVGTPEEMRDLAARREQAAEDQRNLDRVEREVERLMASPELRGLKDSIVLQQTPEGLRIQITDRPQFSMFAVGSARMNEQGRRLMQAISRVLAEVPNGVAITGHTDSLGYADGTKYGNWELSSDRANAARRELLAAGLHPAQLKRVEGRADLDHLVDNPVDPRNRRISITLLRRVPA